MEKDPNKRQTLFTTPLPDQKDPKVYTTAKFATTPVQFYDPNSYKDKINEKEKKKAIVPCVLKNSELNKTRPGYTLDTVFRDFKIEKDGDLRLINKDLLKRQKGLLAGIIAKAASKILEGKKIVGLSLPTKIFEPRQTMERFCDLFACAPHFLNQAAACDNPQERIENVTAFVMQVMPHGVTQWKPFNPLLGETFNGKLPDGTELYLEHTSHHPPITQYYIINKNWKITGWVCYTGKMKGNNFNPFNEGWGHVEFKDGGKNSFYLPSLSLKGMLIGKRKTQWVSTLCVKDPKNLVKQVIKFNADAHGTLKGLFKSSPQDTFKGMVYKYDENLDKKLIAKEKDHWYEMMKEQGNFPDVVKPLAKIEGSWQKEMKIGGRVVWSLERDLKFCTPHLYGDDPLPSDVRYREDMTWKWHENEEQSQIWKLLLEEQQRKDRKIRKEMNKKMGRTGNKSQSYRV